MNAKIGLFGFGVVGQGFHQILTQMNGTAPGTLARICVRDPKKMRSLPSERFSYEPAEILEDPEISHVVELIDRPADAYQLVRTALERNKTVISANKAMLAQHLPELLHLQQTGHGQLFYEAAACGSIPIFKNLEQYYVHDEISAIEGIFNGSTNYLLTQMAEHGLSFGQALAQAQALGFAEADPSLDIDAQDPASKLSLLIAQAFGQWLPPDQVFRFGLRNIHRVDISYAARQNQKIRLIAAASRTETGDLQAIVLPSLVDSGSPFYSLNDEYNGILIKSKLIGNQLLTGKGAGSLPTGFAVLNDLRRSLNSSTRQHLSVQHAKSGLGQKLMLYSRCPDPKVLDALPFEKIHWKHSSEAGLQVVGEIQLEEAVLPVQKLAAAGGFLAKV